MRNITLANFGEIYLVYFSTPFEKKIDGHNFDPRTTNAEIFRYSHIVSTVKLLQFHIHVL